MMMMASALVLSSSERISSLVLVGLMGAAHHLVNTLTMATASCDKITIILVWIIQSNIRMSASQTYLWSVGQEHRDATAYWQTEPTQVELLGDELTQTDDNNRG